MLSPSSSQFYAYLDYILEKQITGYSSSDYSIENLYPFTEADTIEAHYKGYYSAVASKYLTDSTITTTNKLKIQNMLSVCSRVLNTKPWLNDGGCIITFKELTTDEYGFKSAVFHFDIDRAKFDTCVNADGKIKNNTNSTGYYYLVNIMPIFEMQLGPVSQMMWKDAKTDTTGLPYHDGEHLRGLAGSSIFSSSYGTELNVGLRIPLLTNVGQSFQTKNTDRITSITDTEDELSFDFAVPLNHWILSNPTTINMLQTEAQVRATLTPSVVLTKSISFAFINLDSTIYNSSYNYNKDYLYRAIETLGYSSVSAIDPKGYPPTKPTQANWGSSQTNLYQVKADLGTYTGSEYDLWKSTFKWSFSKLDSKTYIFKTNLPTYGIQFLGDAGAYFSYLTSSLPDQTAGSSGYFRDDPTPKTLASYDGGSGYFKSTYGLLVKVPATEIIATQDAAGILCLQRKDNRCTISYDPDLDFQYINKYYYELKPEGKTPEYWSFGTGAKSVSTKALNGYVVGNMLGLLYGYGATWTTRR